MDMTRRQFDLSIAAATTLRSSLFGSTLSPVGVPRGVVPGRVTWSHDPSAVTWDGTGSWWTDANKNQSVIDRMVSRSVCALTNQKKDAQAWNSVFQYFNRTHGRGKAGYKAGEKIAIKVNLNNTTDHGTIERLNSSPHFDTFACPTVDWSRSSAGISDHRLRFQPVHPWQSLRQNSP
jgi:hypothetical protein